MNYKDFKDYSELVQILKNRQLIVKNEEQAINFFKEKSLLSFKFLFYTFLISKEFTK